eukprot:TRINITY_DN5644_c0_g1_i1.p1 TRINITY_DN5644_c0_g1~~TRINITY_DN5644_c0_g1_i1.p1  ORF type:complete len:765 (-),score=173.89 TRINITY_DN5644_c0_g1_i1:120-2414(-)
MYEEMSEDPPLTAAMRHKLQQRSSIRTSSEITSLIRSGNSSYGQRKSHSGYPKYKHSITEQDYDTMSKIESLDYVIVDSEIYREHERKVSAHRWDDGYRWVLVGLIGLVIGLIALGVHLIVVSLNAWRLSVISPYLQKHNIFEAYIFFLLFNVTLGVLGCLPILWEPAAQGSGLPEVKGYLNGVRIPHAFNLRNMIASTISVVCAVSSSLPVGPEGPLIHIGGMVGGGLGELRSRTLNFRIPLLPRFQNSRDRRDFISCGAACGVAAAFGAPIGGVLFALEEACSFWSSRLTWRTFFGTMAAVLIMNLGVNKWSGVVNTNQDTLFEISTNIASFNLFAVLLVSIILGVFGGLAGGVFTYLNLKVNKFRRRFINKKRIYKVMEVICLIILFSAVIIFSPLGFACQPLYPGNNIAPAANSTIRYTCPPGHFNDYATLLLSAQEDSVDHLIGVSDDRFTRSSLICFFVVYFVGAVLTAGCGLSTGLFVPMMLIGGSYGRLLGALFNQSWSVFDNLDPGIFALVGAASFMCGVTRMTVSLVVILIEVTNDIQFLVPIITTVMVSKAVGDYLTYPLYDAQLHQKSIPFLESESINVMDTMKCSDTMARGVVCFHLNEKVGNILKVLRATTHNGFPVVEGDNKYKGLIQRRHVLCLIQHRIFANQKRLNHDEFWAAMNGPRVGLTELQLSPSELDMEIECWLYMNLSAIIVHEDMGLSTAFRLFRTMGLRHLTVVDDSNIVVGMITRKDLLHEVCEHKYEELASSSSVNI